jgi:TonB family protein
MPQYPLESLQKRETGTVKLVFEIDERGRATASRVKSSSGSLALDRAALVALSRCPFAPARRNGQPIAAEAEVTYEWRIE